jgi:hypothetical protein
MDKTRSQAVVGATELGRHLAGNRELVSRLSEKGVIEALPDGKYDLDDCRERYIKYLRSRKPRGGANVELLAARTKLAELRLQERAHTVVKTDEVTAALQFMAGTCVTTFESLPGSIAQARTDPALRANLTDWVRKSRTHVADACDAHAASLEATGEAHDQK